jgi:hypothetical protein
MVILLYLEMVLEWCVGNHPLSKIGATGRNISLEMLSSEGDERVDQISLDKDQISTLLHHVRRKGEEKVGEIASEFGVSEVQLKEYWQANRMRWQKFIASAEAERQKVALGDWKPHEDTVILSHVYAKGDHPDWREIARALGRQICDIKQHYREELIGKSKIWTARDNMRLIEIRTELGPKWQRIAEQMDRTITEVQLRYGFLISAPGRELMKQESITVG